MEQEELVSRLRQSDGDALREVMERYTPYLCTIAGNLAVPPLTTQDVEEIVSDTFVRLWNHRQNLDSKRSLKGYLTKTTRNLVVDALRARKGDCLPLLEEILRDEDSLETALEQKEALHRLKEHLAALAPEERDILTRFYYYNQRTCDIARDTGLTHGALRTRLCRLRVRLKETLSKEGRQ